MKEKQEVREAAPAYAGAKPQEAAVQKVAAILESRYGKYPDESSGPVLDQLVWFLLSTRTTVENCEAAFSALRSRYPSWEAVADAPETELYAPLRPAGLYRARARNVIAALAAIKARFGEASLEDLRSWPDADCEAFLLGLPGVGLKVARCVMAFGLARRVFAVDAHIWRITRRLGWHDFPGDAPSDRGAGHIQAIALAAADPLSLHVNLIRLGREFCPAGEPRCEGCPLAGLCSFSRTGSLLPSVQAATGAETPSTVSPDAERSSSDILRA
jgi:endonuclease III